MEHQVEQLKDQLKQLEKMASLGLLTAGIAHEIQNPLNFVINFSKMSDRLIADLTEIVASNKDRLPDDDREELEDITTSLQENMRKIVQHSERAIDIIHSILLVSRGKDDQFIPSDIVKIVKEYTWLSYHAMRAKDRSFNVAITEQYEAGIPKMKVIPQDLSRAVLNLMNNAFYAVRKKAETASADYKPEVEVCVGTDGDKAVVSITDNGTGMDEETRQRLYENFFTTKPIGEGTGLGMGITKDIIERKHQGQLTFSSKEGEGTRFIFTIPIRK